MAALMIASCGCGKKDPENTTDPKNTDASTTNKVVSGDNTENPNNNVDYNADLVKEDDPFFAASEVILDVPKDPDLKVEYSSLHGAPIFAGKYIAQQYHVQYVLPDEIQKQVDQMQFPQDTSKYQELIAGKYYIEGWAIFSSAGEYLFTLSGDDALNLPTYGRVFEFSDGRLGMFFAQVTFEGDDIKIEPFVFIFDSKGEMLEKKPIQGMQNMPLTGQYAVLPDGRLLFMEDYMTMLMDKDANLIWQVSNDSMTTMETGRIEGVFYENGKLYCIFNKITESGDQNVSERTIQEMDINSGNPIGSREALSPNVPSVLFPGEDGIYGIGANGVVKVDIITGTREALINWNETDVNCKRLDERSCRVMNSDEMAFFQEPTRVEGSQEEGSYKLIHFQRAAKNPHAGKALLHLAAYGVNSEELIDQVVEYNQQTGAKARVMLYDYADEIDRTLPPFQASADVGYKVFEAMRSGTGPDIVMNFTDFGEFENEKVLIDLNTYIDSTNGIDRSLYFDNVMRAFETNGKLYQMPLTFYVYGLVGNKEYCGERTGWTYSEYSSFLSSLPSDMTAFYSITSQHFLDDMVSGDMSHFVNYDTGEVSFDSDEFATLLEVAKKCEVSRNNREELDDESYHSPDANAITLGICAMNEYRFASLANSYGRYCDVNQGNVTFLGYPTAEGKGFSARAALSVGISAFSRHQDEAWDFVRYLLSLAPKNKHEGASILRSAVDAQNTVDIDNYHARAAQSPDPKTHGSAPLDEEKAKTWITMIENVHTKYVSYPDILSVINEEASAYFAGQKNAKDVAATIQNRVALIIAESK